MKLSSLVSLLRDPLVFFRHRHSFHDWEPCMEDVPALDDVTPYPLRREKDRSGHRPSPSRKRCNHASPPVRFALMFAQSTALGELWSLLRLG